MSDPTIERAWRSVPCPLKRYSCFAPQQNEPDHGRDRAADHPRQEDTQSRDLQRDEHEQDEQLHDGKRGVARQHIAGSALGLKRRIEQIARRPQRDAHDEGRHEHRIDQHIVKFRREVEGQQDDERPRQTDYRRDDHGGVQGERPVARVGAPRQRLEQRGREAEIAHQRRQRHRRDDRRHQPHRFWRIRARGDHPIEIAERGRERIRRHDEQAVPQE
jgi:hypothetical protein